MEIPCPNGYMWYMNGYTIPRTVTIFSGTCNHCDLCGIEDCGYNDQSPEATKRWIDAMLECNRTIENQLAEEQKTRVYREFYDRGRGYE